MTVLQGSRGWLRCPSPRRSLAAVWASARGEQRKVRRWRVTGGVKAARVNSFLLVKLSCLALVTCKQLPQDSKEENEGAVQRDSEKALKAERSAEESGQPLWAPYLHSRVCCLCCVWLLCSPKQLKATVCTWWLMWRGVESLKGMRPPQGQSSAFSASLGRDFSLCMWLGAGPISFSGIRKTRKGNPFPCKYQLHDGVHSVNTQLLRVLLPPWTLATSVLNWCQVSDATENIFSNKCPLTGSTECALVHVLWPLNGRLWRKKRSWRRWQLLPGVAVDWKARESCLIHKKMTWQPGELGCFLDTLDPTQTSSFQFHLQSNTVWRTLPRAHQ